MPIATARLSQPDSFTNRCAWSGSVRCFSISLSATPCAPSSIPPSCPSSASTLTYGLCACARSQIFFVSAMFFSIGSPEPSYITEVYPSSMHFIAVSKSPWSRWIATGISGDSAQPASISARR